MERLGCGGFVREKDSANGWQRTVGEPSLLLLLRGGCLMLGQGPQQQVLVMQGKGANPVSQARATSRADHRAAVLYRPWPFSAALPAQSQPCATSSPLENSQANLFLYRST